MPLKPKVLWLGRLLLPVLLLLAITPYYQVWDEVWLDTAPLHGGFGFPPRHDSGECVKWRLFVVFWYPSEALTYTSFDVDGGGRRRDYNYQARPLWEIIALELVCLYLLLLGPSLVSSTYFPKSA
jgi:hypothetical protein